MKDNLITAEQAMCLLNISSRNTLKSWAKKMGWRVWKEGAKYVRYSENEIKHFLKSIEN